MSQPTIESVIEEQLSKELDVLENAISDENRALAICSREEIWKIVERLRDVARSEERTRCVEIVERYYPEVKDSLADNVAVLSIYKEITNNK